MDDKIFISYSHQDNLCALGIARYLKKQGYNVWIDSDQLKTGKDWANDINEALAQSTTVICILSSNSIKRKEVLRELKFSFDKMNKEGENKFRILFVVVGDIHRSWFLSYDNDEKIKEIIDYINKHQYI